MRFGEDSYENNFLDDFSGYGGYGGLSTAAPYTPPAATYTAPMGGLTAAPGPAPYSPPELTPEFLAELQASAALMKQKIEAASDPNRNAAFDKYVADQAAKGVEVASTYTGGGGPLGSGGVLGVTDFAPAFDPANPAGTTGQVVRFDEGKMNAPVVFQPGQQYVLTDAFGENVVGRASSVEELQKLADAQGNMPYGFQLYQADQQGNYKPGTQLFGQSDPRVGGLMGIALEYGLPLATAFIPGLGQLGLLAQMGSAGGASGFGNLMAGNTPEKALTSALISAGTAGLLKGTPIGETINKAVGSVIPGLSSVAEKGGSALAQKSVEALAPGMLEAVGQRLGSSLVSNLATGALSAAGGSLLGDVGKSLVQPDQFQQAVDQGRIENRFGPAPDADELLALGQRAAPTIPGTEMLAAITGNALTAPLSPLDMAPRPEQPPQQPGEPEIVVSSTAPPKVNLTGVDLTGGLSGAAAAGFDQFLSDNAGMVGDGTTATEEPEALAEARRAADALRVTGPLTAAASTLVPAQQPAATEEPEALAEADRVKRFEAEAAAAAAAGAAATSATDGPLQTVTNTSTADTRAQNAVAGSAGAAAQESAQTTSERTVDQSQEQAETKKDSILSKVNPVRAGLSALAGIVSLLGSGGGGGRGVATGNAGAGTRASLDPIFSAKLPAASPQYSGTSFAPRDMRGVDFARYGYGPGMSFFENVPRNPEEYKAALAANTPAARPSGALNLPPVAMPQTVGGTAADPTASATSLIRTYIPSATDAEIAEFLATEEGMQFLTRFGEPPVGRARGGSMRGTGTSRNSYAVKGAGTGRSDEIPALLSDGEYVIDAETVAMLGDGSSEAGAKRLDDFRIKIRKHKGRNLAKGKFSANAKRPEKYLAGGRA